MTSNFTALSLFSSGGGLDIGFESAGFVHSGSYEILDVCCDTLRLNRPNWDITQCDLSVKTVAPCNQVDVVHGGPPCQPFSTAGRGLGNSDHRNMWPAFTRVVNELQPMAFVAENVKGILSKRFDAFMGTYIFDALPEYSIHTITLNASDFTVPQNRNRVFFIGFRSMEDFAAYVEPAPTGSATARAVLRLPDVGFDGVVPTIRSAFTGKRNTTSILNGASGQAVYGELGLWPNGVQLNRKRANEMQTKDGTYRLTVSDCAALQGFSTDWIFSGCIYQILGQIGNSVPPPLSEAVARSVYRVIEENCNE